MSCPAHEMAAAKGLLTSEQVDELTLAAKGLPQGPTLVYDLGSGSGLTALCVLQGRKSDITVISVDNRDQEMYWAGIAVENVGRKNDWRGIVGDVLDKSLVPDGEIEFQHIDLLIIDLGEEVDLADILELWAPAMSPSGNIWNNGRFIDWSNAPETRPQPPETIPDKGPPTRPQQPETIPDKGPPAEEEKKEEPLPCNDCDYVTPEGKNPERALQAHARIHK